MKKPVNITIKGSACPHDCPSTCALDVEVIDGTSIGRIRGAKENSYTAGVICAKVARYSERIHHPNRLKEPLIRRGEKGGGDWASISWDAALDEIAERFAQAAQRDGTEAVWPHHYAGTMGLVQRDSIQRFRHAGRYSKQHDTICINMAWTGFAAGTGEVRGPDPREMAESDCVVIWGTNAVATQVNVMTHATRARKARGAKIVVIDVYETDTMKQADLALCLRPGTDGALACAVMHCLFRDGKADRAYMERYADDPRGLEAHLKDRTPEWASAITGLTVDEIEAFAQLLGERPRSYLRLGYGFTRSRNGAINMHAAQCIATVLGAWQHKGGGAFHNNADIFKMDASEIKGSAMDDPAIRTLDQSQVGRILTGDATSLLGGPPVTATLVQNTNPINVAPEQALVKQGFARDDLFVAVHEQFMTETAQMADIVLPATMFMEHDDVYRGGGHQFIIHGPKLIDGPEGCRENLFVINELANRLGFGDAPGFGKSANELIDGMMQASGYGTLEELRTTRWVDCQPDFETSHYLNGFSHADGKFHLRADWSSVPWGQPPERTGLLGPVADAPGFPDHWDVLETADEAHPYRLATSPARSFLNSTFTETPGSQEREGKPSVFMHPDDINREGLSESATVELRNERGAVRLAVRAFDGLKPGVLVAEGIHPNAAHEGSHGINTLVGADPVAPHGGAAFHDVKVAVSAV